jgi:hypothetical protein
MTFVWMYWPLLLGGIRFCLRLCHLIAGSVPRVRWARRSVPLESTSVVRCTPDTAIRHFHLPEYFRAKGEFSIFFFEGDIKALSLSFFEFHTGVRTIFFENSKFKCWSVLFCRPPNLGDSFVHYL